MAAITFFSLQGADASSDVSLGISEKILSVVPGYKDAPEAQKQAVLVSFNVILRDLAHFSIFFVLGFLVNRSFLHKGIRFSLVVSLIWCALYALFDECLQKALNNGRAFEMADLLKDWSGEALGNVISAVSEIITVKKRNNHISEGEGK